MIPLVDLAAQQREVADEVRAGWDDVLDSTSFVGGPQIAQFERAFAEYQGVAECIAVASGTDALEIALRAAGIGVGDSVMVPTNSFIASALAVVRAGATPNLVDCDDDGLISVTDAANRVTPSTRAIMPVHLYGQCAPMADVQRLAAAHDLLVIEDAAQAQGARQEGRGAGSMGVAAGTSFYPGKNLGAYGDAGACLTNDAGLAAHMRALRNYGSETKYEHPELGFNSRMDTLQAVVLSAKLRRLEAWNEQRRAAADRYQRLLQDFDEVRLPRTIPGNEHVWHLYVISVPDRDRVVEHLHASGIGAGVHYPRPIHLQPAFAHLGHSRGDFPVSERLADQIVSLPLFPGITAEQQEQVASSLSKALR